VSFKPASGTTGKKSFIKQTLWFNPWITLVFSEITKRFDNRDDFLWFYNHQLSKLLHLECDTSISVLLQGFYRYLKKMKNSAKKYIGKQYNYYMEE